jgi:hypothetical protein
MHLEELIRQAVSETAKRRFDQYLTGGQTAPLIRHADSGRGHIGDDLHCSATTQNKFISEGVQGL